MLRMYRNSDGYRMCKLAYRYEHGHTVNTYTDLHICVHVYHHMGPYLTSIHTHACTYIHVAAGDTYGVIHAYIQT